ncbi:hypothetical protein GCM10027347_02530 [Larkinella harenae]
MKKALFGSLIAVAFSVWNCTMNDHLPPNSIAYQLDDTKSVAVWKGSLRTGYFEEGTIGVTSDWLAAKDGRIVGGSFTIPVSSIVSTSLPDSLKPVLVHHLQTADFFDMATHPNVTYAITSLEPYSGSDGIAGANFRVNGSLTLLGKSHPVSFPANIQLTGNQVTVEATLQIDRTKWGMLYSSDPALPDERYIKPAIDIHLKLAGHKK